MAEHIDSALKHFHLISRCIGRMLVHRSVAGGQGRGVKRVAEVEQQHDK